MGNFGFTIPDSNKYIELFRLLYKYYRGGKDIKYEMQAKTLLNSLRVNLKTIWGNMQFYGYGSERYRYYINGKEVDMTISKLTAISKYLEYSLDLSYNSIITRVVHESYGGYIHGLSVDMARKNLKVADLIDYYNMFVRRYKRNFLEDFKQGKVFSEVCLDAYPPNGFGMIKLVPKDVIWYVEIPLKKAVSIGNTTIKVSKYESIPVSQIVRSFGNRVTYRYPTYGYKIESQQLHAQTNIIAATLFVAMLRLIYKIRPDEIGYSANKYEINVWESYPSGLINHIDYSRLVDYVKSKESSTNSKMELFKHVAYVDIKSFYYAIYYGLVDQAIAAFYDFVDKLKKAI
ncbi:MAG: hypothetical protein F7B61_03735 [Caldisphaeraceae archaeon]|nr:hypothetical protein [Caldisphaeraceae archaeon]